MKCGKISVGVGVAEAEEGVVTVGEEEAEVMVEVSLWSEDFGSEEEESVSEADEVGVEAKEEPSDPKEVEEDVEVSDVLLVPLPDAVAFTVEFPKKLNESAFLASSA